MITAVLAATVQTGGQHSQSEWKRSHNYIWRDTGWLHSGWDLCKQIKANRWGEGRKEETGKTPVKVNVNGREDHESRLSQADDAAEDDDEKNTILFPC